MLNLILGRSGTGKTEYVRTLLGDKAKLGDNKLILIVPEQFSYSCERALLENLGPKTANNIEVLSFSRLSDFINREVGGIKGTSIDDADKIILMSHALQGIQDHLNFYKIQSTKTYFAKDLITLFSEFRKQEVTSESLKETINTTKKESLKEKLVDLSLIYEQYNMLLELNGLTDSELQTSKVIETLKNNKVFKDYTICIDAFKGFTGQEFSIIRELINQVDNLYLTLCYDENDDAMTFGAVKKDLETIMSFTKDINVTTLDNSRFNSDALKFVEANIFKNNDNVYGKETDDIELYAADTKYDECNFIAARVRKFMREDGLHLRDIAIVTRDEDAYKAELKAALSRFDIPIYEDRRQPINAQPLVVLMKSLINIMRAKELPTKDILNYLKTGFSPLNETEAAELENYVYTWNIKGAQWNEPFLGDPRGITDEKNVVAIEKMNDYRLSIMTDIDELREDCKGTCLDICEKLYNFLNKKHIKAKFIEHAKSLDSTGVSDLAMEQNRVWELVMEILDKLATIQGDDTISLDNFYDLFCAVCDTATLGTLPHGLDELTIGSADRVRLSNPKVVFVCGTIEGEFPRDISTNSLLTASDRKKLSFELSASNEIKACDERFIAYQALTSSTDKLIVTCHKKRGASEGLEPSIIYKDLEKRFKNNVLESLDAYFYSETKNSTFATFASGHHKVTEQNVVEYNTIRQALSGEFEEKFEALRDAETRKPYQLNDSELIKKTFGENIGLSPSRVETFYNCPFQYFCRYGLKVAPTRRVEISSQIRGSAIHAILEKILKEHSKEQFISLSNDEQNELIEKYLNEFLEEHNIKEMSKDAKFAFECKKICTSLSDILKRMIAEFKVSTFEPVDYECNVETSLDIGDNCRLYLKGNIDRVDKFTSEDGKEYIRVVDYKTYVKTFDLNDVIAGLNMQMLIYLFAAAEKFKADPAAVLYYKAKALAASFDRRDVTEEEIFNKKIENNLSSGLYLDDEQVKEAIESSKNGRRFYAFNEDELVSLEEMGKIENKVNENLINLCKELKKGTIDVYPATHGNTIDGCTYCDYKNVCGFEGEAELCHEIDKEGGLD